MNESGRRGRKSSHGISDCCWLLKCGKRNFFLPSSLVKSFSLNLFSLHLASIAPEMLASKKLLKIYDFHFFRLPHSKRSHPLIIEKYFYHIYETFSIVTAGACLPLFSPFLLPHSHTDNLIYWEIFALLIIFN